MSLPLQRFGIHVLLLDELTCLVHFCLIIFKKIESDIPLFKLCKNEQSTLMLWAMRYRISMERHQTKILHSSTAHIISSLKRVLLTASAYISSVCPF
jgi:hypothetical protein